MAAGSSQEHWAYASPASFTNVKTRRLRPRPVRHPLQRLRTLVSVFATLPSPKQSPNSGPSPNRNKRHGSTRSSSIRRPSHDAFRRESASAPACRNTKVFRQAARRVAIHASRHSANFEALQVCALSIPRARPSCVLCQRQIPNRPSTFVAP